MCVELPEEGAGGKDEEDLVALLLESLYGARYAAMNFQFEIRKVLEKNRITTGKYNVSTNCHPTMQLNTLVHGGDFVTVGDVKDIEWVTRVLEGRFEIKSQVIGTRNVNATNEKSSTGSSVHWMEDGGTKQTKGMLIT